jgi:cell wall-associated NlpC family hydrolase
MRRLALGFLIATLGVVLMVMSAPVAHAGTVPLRLRALRWAEAQAGTPYVFGGTGGGGFDCSGLVMSAYAAEGVHLPRTTFAMLGSSHLRLVPYSQRKRGMLAFYGSGHVELVTRRGTFGAEAPGTVVGWHHPGGSWFPTAIYEVLP